MGVTYQPNIDCHRVLSFAFGPQNLDVVGGVGGSGNFSTCTPKNFPCSPLHIQRLNRLPTSSSYSKSVTFVIHLPRERERWLLNPISLAASECKLHYLTCERALSGNKGGSNLFPPLAFPKTSPPPNSSLTFTTCNESRGGGGRRDRTKWKKGEEKYPLSHMGMGKVVNGRLPFWAKWKLCLFLDKWGFVPVTDFHIFFWKKFPKSQQPRLQLWPMLTCDPPSPFPFCFPLAALCLHVSGKRILWKGGGWWGGGEGKNFGVVGGRLLLFLLFHLLLYSWWSSIHPESYLPFLNKSSAFFLPSFYLVVKGEGGGGGEGRFWQLEEKGRFFSTFLLSLDRRTCDHYYYYYTTFPLCTQTDVSTREGGGGGGGRKIRPEVPNLICAASRHLFYDPTCQQLPATTLSCL